MTATGAGRHLLSTAPKPKAYFARLSVIEPLANDPMDAMA
jgi:hypothetical protein